MDPNESRVRVILTSFDTRRFDGDRTYAVESIRVTIWEIARGWGDASRRATVSACLRMGARLARARFDYAAGAVLVCLASAAERHAVGWTDIDN